MKEMIKSLSDKASDYLDTKGLANPVEVINQELGGETREESKARREKAKEPKPQPSLEERKKAAATKAHEEYTNDQKNWPLNPKKDAINSAKAADAVKMKTGGKVSSASSRADGCATKGHTRGTIVMCGGGMMKGKK